MTSVDENVKILSRAVLSDVNSNAEQILAEARTKAGEIRVRAQEQAEAERARILDQAKVEAERVRSQAVAITQLKARTMELEQREKIIENVFETARQNLASVQDGSGYEQITQLLLREALNQLGAPAARIRADESTRKFLTSGMLDKISAELKIQLTQGETLKKGVGVIVETVDGRRQYDNTLETRLKRIQDTVRSPVYHILMGEPL